MKKHIDRPEWHNIPDHCEGCPILSAYSSAAREIADIAKKGAGILALLGDYTPVTPEYMSLTSREKWMYHLATSGSLQLKEKEYRIDSTPCAGLGFAHKVREILHGGKICGGELRMAVRGQEVDITPEPARPSK